MELINQILQTIINSFDVAYCLVVNFLTYILISSIISVIHKQITRVWKRVILCISIVIVSIAYINFGSIVLRDTPETTINSNIHFICDPGDIGKTMSVSFSKTTIENGGNSLDFDIFINGNQVIANQTYDFVLNDQDIIMVPVVFKLTNTTNSISSRSGVYTSSILLTYSY